MSDSALQVGARIVASCGARSLSDLTAVTVTYNPDLQIFAAQLGALRDIALVVVIDNASTSEVLGGLRALVKDQPNAMLICNGQNEGLAAAINRGVKIVSQEVGNSSLVLLLDQDTEPCPGSLATLFDAYQFLDTSGARVGCIGPLLLDADTRLTHGFHQCSKWRWWRVYPKPSDSEPVWCSNLNGSGTLVSVDLFDRLGGLNEALFIDHVDTDWAFRVLAAGYGLWGIPTASFIHRMGRDSVRFWWFGWRVWPSRSPQRHYFLFRNAFFLMRQSYVPVVWKVWGATKLLATAFIVGVASKERGQHLRSFAKGVKDAMRAG